MHFFSKEGNNAWKYSAATAEDEEEEEDFSGQEEDNEAEVNKEEEEGKEESAAALPKLFQNSRPIVETLEDSPTVPSRIAPRRERTTGGREDTEEERKRGQN